MYAEKKKMFICKALDYSKYNGENTQFLHSLPIRRERERAICFFSVFRVCTRIGNKLTKPIWLSALFFSFISLTHSLTLLTLSFILLKRERRISKIDFMHSHWCLTIHNTHVWTVFCPFSDQIWYSENDVFQIACMSNAHSFIINDHNLNVRIGSFWIDLLQIVFFYHVCVFFWFVFSIYGRK